MFVAYKLLLIFDEIVFYPTCTEKPILKFLYNKFFSIYNYLFRFFCFYSVFNEQFRELCSLVGPSGLEPPTSCLSGTRSNLLSYEPIRLVCDFRFTWVGLSSLVEMMGFDSRANYALGLPRSQTSTGSLLCTVSPSNPAFLCNSHHTISVTWWRWWDSNPWPPACRAGALPAELHPHIGFCCFSSSV